MDNKLFMTRVKEEAPPFDTLIDIRTRDLIKELVDTYGYGDEIPDVIVRLAARIGLIIVPLTK